MSYFEMLRAYAGQETLILPGASVILHDEQERVLLQKRTDGEWGLPGGLMEPGESFAETVCRETCEETGLVLDPESLVMFDVFSGEAYFVKAPNGDPYYAVTALFTCSRAEGILSTDNDETLDLQWYPLDRLPHTLKPNHQYFLRLFKEQTRNP